MVGEIVLLQHHGHGIHLLVCICLGAYEMNDREQVELYQYYLRQIMKLNDELAGAHSETVRVEIERTKLYMQGQAKRFQATYRRVSEHPND